jgi:hypothetical protein
MPSRTYYVAHEGNPGSSIWTKAFWKASAERVIATAAEAGGAYLVTAGPIVDALHVNWNVFGGVAAGAAVLALLKSLAANAATQTGPSFTNSEQVVPAESPEAVTSQARNVDLTPPANPRDLDGDGRDDSTGRFVPRG